ncbi:MAG: RHS repeat-associated core domain-containing protein [Bacteriovoracaceae bacterium]
MIQCFEIHQLGFWEKYRDSHYDASAGRFLQEDPHPGTSAFPASLNSKYVYVSNDPVNKFDPTGKIEPFTILLIGAAIAGAINATVFAATTKGVTIGSFATAFATGAIGAFVGGGLGILTGGMGGALLGGAITGSLTSFLNTATLTKEDPFSGKNVLKMVFGAAFGAAGGLLAYSANIAIGGMMHAAQREFAIGASTGVAGSSIQTPVDGTVDMIDNVFPGVFHN